MRKLPEILSKMANLLFTGWKQHYVFFSFIFACIISITYFSTRNSITKGNINEKYSHTSNSSNSVLERQSISSKNNKSLSRLFENSNKGKDILYNSVIEALKQHDLNEQRSAVQIAIREAALNNDLDGCKSIVELLSPGWMRTNAIGEVIQNWRFSEGGLDDLCDWLAGLELPEEKQCGIREFMSKIPSLSTERAIEIAIKLEPLFPDYDTYSIASVGAQMAEAGYGLRLAESSLESISNPERKQIILEMYVTQNACLRPSDAVKQIESGALEKKLAEKVIETLAVTQGPQNPQQWMTWIQRLNDEHLAAAGVEALIRRVAQQDSILASKLSSNLQPGKLQKAAYLAIARHMISIGAEKEAEQYQHAAEAQ